MKLLKLVFLTALLISTQFFAVTSYATNPDEVLNDPALETRAREISSKVRCMVCQNQNIDDSDAEVARDLRILIRERLVEGSTNQEVYDYLVSKYGEFILLQPRLKMNTLLLWGLPIFVLLIGAFGLIIFLRKSKPQENTPLTNAEKKALEKLLEDE